MAFFSSTAWELVIGGPLFSDGCPVCSGGLPTGNQASWEWTRRHRQPLSTKERCPGEGQPGGRTGEVRMKGVAEVGFQVAPHFISQEGAALTFGQRVRYSVADDAEQAKSVS